MVSHNHDPLREASPKATPHTRHVDRGQEFSGIDTRRQGLQEYLKARSDLSNDCAWLHGLISSAVNLATELEPVTHLRLHYQNRDEAPAITANAFESSNLSIPDVERCLRSKNLCAVTICHRDSSRVDPRIVNLLWRRFGIEEPFMRHHFDYKGFRDEEACPTHIRDRLEKESEMIEDYWTLGGRWNPIRLPSETQGSVLRLSVDSECLSVCHKDGVVITFVRSLAVYKIPTNARQSLRRDRDPFPCINDLYTATLNASPTSQDDTDSMSDFSLRIIHFYARLLILRCYEDYVLRHDPQPIHLDESDRVTTKDYPHLRAIRTRQLEIINLKQDLAGYLGPAAPDHRLAPNGDQQDQVDKRCLQKLQGLLTDLTMLQLSYDQALTIYERYVAEISRNYQDELASEQLDETKESKATAISLGKLSTVAFVFLPLNFVCAVLGMNLAVLGQGTVPVWVFLVMVFFSGLLTYLPFLPKLSAQRLELNKVAYHLAWRSPTAAFWFLAFTFTHDYGQNFEILNSGLTQVLLGGQRHRTKGWTDGVNDSKFETATLGNKAFWKGKVQKIFDAVKELKTTNDDTQLDV